MATPAAFLLSFTHGALMGRGGSGNRHALHAGNALCEPVTAILFPSGDWHTARECFQILSSEMEGNPAWGGHGVPGRLLIS